jgi:hypothetical protein
MPSGHQFVYADRITNGHTDLDGDCVADRHGNGDGNQDPNHNADAGKLLRFRLRAAMWRFVLRVVRLRVRFVLLQYAMGRHLCQRVTQPVRDELLLRAADPDCHENSDPHADQDVDGDADQDRNEHTDRNTNCHDDGNADGSTHHDADSHGDREQYTDSDSDWDADSHDHRYAYG